MMMLLRSRLKFMNDLSGTIALIGNPNTGKTALFNALTGLNLKVSNYPGVTVERKTGNTTIGDKSVEIIDLPGTYSLVPESQDEVIVAMEVDSWVESDHAPACIISVVDATNLERNLYLTSQLLDLGIPVIVALNMMDLARKKSLAIDAEKLNSTLGTAAIVPISARYREGIKQLKYQVAQTIRHPVDQAALLTIPDPVKEAIGPMINEYKKGGNYTDALLHSYAIRSVTTGQGYGNTTINGSSLESSRANLRSIGFPPETLEPALRYHWLDQVVPAAEIHIETQTRSEKIDKVLIHKWTGPIVFMGLLTFIFQAIFSWSTIPMDWIDSGIASFGNWVASTLPASVLKDLLVEGIIGGAGAVLIFLPQILILIFFLSLLEDTGYMARVAIMMDKIMVKVGLHGRSVLPLMSGYACAIPGIMATRTIDSWKERLVTILVLPLMSCSARLPVYALMIGAFIPQVTIWGIFSLQGLTLVVMYFLGTVTALILSIFFSRWVKEERKSSFVMELPPYRVPVMKSIFRQVYTRGKLFVMDAGKIIMAISIVLWFLASFPETETGSDIQRSYAAKIGHAMEPLIKPLGFDWKIGIGLVTSFAAREVMVSTLATIYNVEGGGENVVSITESLKNDLNPETGEPNYTPLVAFSLMVFFVYAAQCMATFAIVKRETNSWKWPVFMVFYMTGLAYLASLIVYQGGSILGYA